jgi:hypothetical protein
MIVQPLSTISMTIGPSADPGGPVVMSDGEPAVESVTGSPLRGTVGELWAVHVHRRAAGRLGDAGTADGVKAAGTYSALASRAGRITAAGIANSYRIPRPVIR